MLKMPVRANPLQIITLIAVCGFTILGCRLSNPQIKNELLDDEEVTELDRKMGAPDRYSTTTAQKLLAEAAQKCQADPTYCQGGVYQINHDAYNNTVQGLKLRDELDFAKVPYKEVKVCKDKITIDGEEACMVTDNAFRYVYQNGQPVETPYLNLIPQHRGRSQPDMERWLQAGDIVVHFHPERRRPQISENAMQWRATHAALVVMKVGPDGTPVLGTVDTPAGYARPFTGVSPSIFHVFRFMPKDPTGAELAPELAQRYRAMVAKWGSLGFNQFSFNGNYDSAAGSLAGPHVLKDLFGVPFIKAARDEAVTIPPMYCAWFVYTNLNLGWMHPLNTLGEFTSGPTELAAVTPGFAWGGVASLDSYLADTEGLQSHENFVFEPMGGADLVHGFLSRLVADDRYITDPKSFVAVAQQKAGLLQAMASDDALLGTFRSSDGMVPAFDGERASQLNAKIPQYFLEFSGLYQEAAQGVMAELADEGAARSAMTRNQVKIEAAYLEQTLHPDFSDQKKRWIPPYLYGYIADNYELKRASGRPQLMYIGTVVPAEYVKPRGEAGDSRLKPIVATPTLAHDLALDRQMYEILGRSPLNDGKGFIAFFQCLAGGSTDECGTSIKRQLLPDEKNALLALASDWNVAADLSTITERTIKQRNDFGLDPTLFRKVLASYWNDPMAAFRPNINSGVTSNLNSVAKNFRTLFTDIPVVLKEAQAPSDTYQAGALVSPLRCVRGLDATVIFADNSASCGHAVGEAADRVYALSPEEAGLFPGNWPH